jgi:hypothetical protein
LSRNNSNRGAEATRQSLYFQTARLLHRSMFAPDRDGNDERRDCSSELRPVADEDDPTQDAAASSSLAQPLAHEVEIRFRLLAREGQAADGGTSPTAPIASAGAFCTGWSNPCVVGNLRYHTVREEILHAASKEGRIGSQKGGTGREEGPARCQEDDRGRK